MHPDNRLSRRNVIPTLLEILDEYSSDEFARQLSNGPINGFIDSVEQSQMFDDMYDPLVSYRATDLALQPEVYEALDAVKALLDDINASIDGRNDSEIVLTPNWKHLMNLASNAARLLRSTELSG